MPGFNFPYELVQLELKSDAQMVFENPPGQLLRLHDFPDR